MERYCGLAFLDTGINEMVRFSLNNCCIFFFCLMKLKRRKLHDFCFALKNFSPHFSSGTFSGVSTSGGHAVLAVVTWK